MWLVISDPIAIEPQTTFVTGSFASGVPDGGPVTIHISSALGNHGKTAAHREVDAAILDAKGATVASGKIPAFDLAPNATHDSPRICRCRTPPSGRRKRPNLYQLVLTVRNGGRTTDEERTEFGIRTATFDKDKGFVLNGKPYPIKGCCVHQDACGVGVAVPDDMQYDRVRRLKAMGANGYRTTHAPPNPGDAAGVRPTRRCSCSRKTAPSASAPSTRSRSRTWCAATAITRASSPTRSATRPRVCSATRSVRRS